MKKQDITLFRMIAVGCCVVYIIVFLFLPFVSVVLTSFGLSGARCLSVGVIAIIPLIAAFAMIVSCLLLPKLSASVICALGAFVPLITAVIERASAADTLVTLLRADSVSSAFSFASQYVLKPGLGPILCIFLGLAAGVLCLLEDGLTFAARNSADPYHLEKDNNDF